jgi:hypothetical protein
MANESEYSVPEWIRISLCYHRKKIPIIQRSHETLGRCSLEDCLKKQQKKVKKYKEIKTSNKKK